MAVNKSLYIIDASVILKWFFEKEEYQREAKLLREDYFPKKRINLIVPNYAFTEILNIMGRQLSGEQVLACVSNLFMFDIQEHFLNLEAISLALEIMSEFSGVSFYDAGYHALAISQDGTFITADKKYFSKTRKKGNIVHLKDYSKEV